MPFTSILESSAAILTPNTLSAPLTSVGDTLASLEGELDLMMGLRADILPERRYYWINQAYVDIASSLELDDFKGSMTFNLVINQPFYLLPRNVGAVRGKFGLNIVDTVTYGPLGGRPLHKSDLDTYRMRGTVTGEPKEWFRERRILVLWPTPKSVRAVSVDYWIVPDDLVLVTDSPMVDREWHQAILLKARSIGFSAVQDFEKGQVAENDFIAYVRKRVGKDEKEDSGRMILSSVPRRASQLIRRFSWRNPEDGL